MSEADHFLQLINGVESRAATARKRAWRVPRAERQRFIYDHTFRNDIEAVAYEIARNLGRLPDFVEPTTFVEKNRALYLTHPNPLMSLGADKIEMRRLCDYVETPIKPPEMYATYSDPRDLNVTELPETCYLKISDGCKMNMLHARGMPVTPLWYRIFLWRKWHLDHWRRHGELHYRDIPKRLLVEEALLPPTSLRETGIFCAFGEPYAVNAKGHNFRGHKKFKGHIPLDDRYAALAAAYGGPLPVEMVGSKDLFEAMLDTARRLSALFAHCRVDFMHNGDRTVIGEITLSPGGLKHPAASPELEIARCKLIDTDRLDDVLDRGKQIAADLGWPTETSFGNFAGDPRLTTGGQ